MQNKGLVICVAVLLTLASIFYLSFSVATSYYDGQAAKIKDPIAQQDYKDSVKYLGIYSYQKCLETQIGLGLDLKGGMNVILEISVPDVVDVLADHKTDAAYQKAMKEAKAQNISFDKFKNAKTGHVELICLFYAGRGQATEDPNKPGYENYIWPQEQDINETIEGIPFNSYFVGNELCHPPNRPRLYLYRRKQRHLY